MSNVVDTLPQALRSLFSEVIGANDARLLTSLLDHEVPSMADRAAVHNILATEFSRNLTSDHEPTKRGREIDSMLGAFLLQWPMHGEDFPPAPLG